MLFYLSFGTMQLAGNAFLSWPLYCVFASVSHHQANLIRAFEAWLHVFSQVKYVFHLFMVSTTSDFFNIWDFFEVLVFKTRANLFRPLFLQSFQLAPSCNKQVWDMGVREPPLPRTNAMFNLGWFGTQTGWYVLFEVNPNTINGICVYREGAVSKADCSFKFTCAVVDWKVMHGTLHWHVRITRCSIGQKDPLLSIWTARDELEGTTGFQFLKLLAT